jgi:OmpA-OmpF porin, OOP family
MRRSSGSLLAIAIALGLVSIPAAAAAQDAPVDPTTQSTQDELAVNRFEPAPAGDRFFGLESAYVAGDPGFHMSLTADYASNPLALSKKLGVSRSYAIVSDQLHLHVGLGVALWERLLVHASMPFALYQSGDDPEFGGVVYTSPSSAELGDLRLGARARLLGEMYDPIQLSISGQLWVPTGGAFAGDKGVRGMPKLVLGGDLADRVVWSFGFGADFRQGQEIAGIAQGTMLRWDGGVGVLLGDDKQIQLGPEMMTAITLDDIRRKNTNAEILLGARYRFHDRMEAGIAAGPGLTPGLGTPDARMIAQISYSPATRRPLVDTDLDGIPDRDDQCPEQAAPPDGGSPLGCPPPPAVHALPVDSDGDGVWDEVDPCPTEAAPASANPDKPGCPAPPPLDSDGDGVVDTDDACPTIPGVDGPDPATRGCPGDTDGDGIRDDLDACPQERGVQDADPSKNGCPGSVRVSGDEIVILQQVLFQTGTSTIDPASNGLLDEVASALADHPEITKIEVQGHTDSRGAAALNTRLSQERAQAVADALATRGVAKERLTAKGYGPDQPIDTNDTEEGRAKNRRVAFKILERAKP